MKHRLNNSEVVSKLAQAPQVGDVKPQTLRIIYIDRALIDFIYEMT